MKNSTYWSINFILVLVCLFFFMNIPHPGGENSEFLCGIIALFLFSTISSILTIPKSPRPNNWEDFSSAIIQKRTLVFLLESIALTIILVSFSTLDYLLLPSNLILAIAIMLAYYSLPFLLSHFYRNRIILLILPVVIFFFQYFLFLNYMPQSNHAFNISIPGLIQAIVLGIHLILILYFFSLLENPASRRILWKETQENLLSFGIVIFILMILGLIADDHGIIIFQSSIVIFLLSTILIFLYGAFLGAKAFAGEKGNNTYNYLVTSPLKSNTILLNKYFSGLGYILLLLGFAILSIEDIPYAQISILIIPFELLGMVYSYCFFASIFLQDTLRSILFGLLALILSASIPCILYYSHTTHLPQIDNPLFLILLAVEILLFYMIILGIIGIAFHSYQQKQFHWQNGFSIMIIAAIFVIYAGDLFVFGNLKPLNANYLPVSSEDNIHVWKNTIYRSIVSGTDNYPNNYFIQAFDYTNLTKPDEVSGIKTIGRAYVIQFHQDKLYSLESCNQGCELVSYNLPDKIHSYSQSSSKRIPLNIQKPFMSRIYIYNNQLILSYSKITGYYLSIRTTGNIPPVNSKIPNTKNHLSIETTQMPSEDPYYYLYSLPDLNLIKQVNHKPKEDYPFLYKDIQTNRDYSFVLDDQSSNLTVYSNQTNQDLREQSHIRDNNRELAQALSNNLAYTINGDYLYLANDQTALEICDLHNAYFFQRTGALAWDWIDRFTSFNSAKEDIYRRFWYRTYHTRSLFVEGNRAVLIQDNGFMVFDISQPEHPRKIAKQTYQPIINWAHDGNRIYIFNRQGMTVFQIP